MAAFRMTKRRYAILRACTEDTYNGPRIYNWRGDIWDRATGEKVTAVVNYLMTHGRVGVTRFERGEGIEKKATVEYAPTPAGRRELEKGPDGWPSR